MRLAALKLNECDRDVPTEDLRKWLEEEREKRYNAGIRMEQIANELKRRGEYAHS
jgi:hypothetical protein